MTMASDPLTDAQMLAIQDSDSDLHYILWDGSAWGTDHELSTNTGETNLLRPFAFVFDAAPAATNDAPVLAGANDLTSIDEDPLTNTGTSISALIAGHVTDPDAGALDGIAVTAVDNTYGTWEYSIDSGGNWTAFGTPTSTSARLLAGNAGTLVRFVPNSDWNGTVSNGITFHAWDQTTGTNGGTADLVSEGTGGATAFSTTAHSSDISVTAVNDAPTFADGSPPPGDDGIVTTDIGSSADNVFGMTVQSDGKVLVVGQSGSGSSSDFALLRYHPNGSLDTSFGTGGVVVTDIAGAADVGFDVTVQPDGKILVSGQSFNGTDYDFAVMRYNSDGSLDAGFGAGGIVTTAFGGLADVGKGITLQADGKILVTGLSHNGTDYDFALVRYNSNGSLDGSFGAGGKVTTGIGADDQAVDVAVQTDGKILVSGDSFNGANNDFALVRYNANGSLDASFGTGGKVTTDFGLSVDKGVRFTLQPDGKILLAGQSHNGSDYDFALARYNTDGSLDIGFGTGGKVTTMIGTGNDLAYNVAVQADGKIVISGDSDNGSDDDFAVVRYNSDGTLDGSFGTGGMVTTAVGAGTDKARAFALQSDGKILLAGFSNNGSDNDIAVVRYNSDGTLDTQFDTTNTLDGNSTFVEGGAAVVLDTDVNVFDVELAAADNYDGATLTLSRNGGANAEDQFSAAGNLVFSAGNLVLSGITVGTVDTNSGGTLQLTFNSNATQARINETLQSIAYSHTSDTPPASVQIDWTFDDGNTGSQGTGGALNTVGSTVVQITAVNDAPVNIVSGPLTALEETPSAIMGLSISDVDAGGGLLTTRLIVGNGTLNVTLVGSATISAGANDSADLTVEGTVADINATLATLTYTSDTDVAGVAADNLTVITNDAGNTGTGGPNTTVNFVQIDITGINDAPERTGGTVSNLTVDEDSGFTSLGLTGLTYGPGGGTDEASQTLTYEITVIPDPNFFGKIYLADGTTQVGTGFYSLTDLQGMQFETAQDRSGLSFFQWRVVDSGGTANGGQNELSEFIMLTVNPINDSPSIATNTGLTVSEGSTGTVITSAMLNEGDPDDAGTGITYTLDAEPINGHLYLSGAQLVGGATFTQEDIDFGRITYDHDGTESTSDSFDFTITDGGEDGATAVSGTFNITVTPINDEEVLAINTGTTVNEGSSSNVLTSGMLQTTDVDNTVGQLVYTVTSATGNGTLRLSGTALGLSDTFTQADINAGNVTYDHDGSETTTDSFDFSVDDGQGTASTGTFNFTVNPVNDEEVLAVNAGTTVNEASTGNVLTSGMLLTTDVDNTSGQLVYTVTAATGNGTLRLSGTALGVSDTFTQADIDAGNVTYDHNGSETTTDSFDFSVDDGQGTASTGTFNFTVNPVNDEEVLVTNTGTTVNEGSTSNVLTSGMLQTTDVDNTAAQLIYTVTSATSNGTLRLSGTVLGVTDTFTQADIDAGNVTYDHNGSETTTDSFDFSVDDGQGTASTGAFNFTVNPVNDEEVLVTNTGATVNEGSTNNVLTSGMLLTADVDNTTGQLIYTVNSATSNGTLWLSGTALGVTDTFTQADIDAGNVTYDHDGSETTTDSFDFSVDDGQGTASTGTFNFTVNPVNDEEVLVTNAGTTVNEGSTSNVLTSGMLQTTDVDNTAAQLIYTVTSATSNGTLRLSGTALGVTDTFTQADIDAGNVTYDHDGSETTTDSFDFSVDDGQGTASTGTFNFTVNPVNDEEMLVTNAGTTVNEGSTSNVLTSGMLLTTDVDNTSGQLVYTVTAATGNGTLRLSGTALGVSDTFTQADIDAGNVTYDHDGSETTTDSFDFSVDDGQGTASTGTFNFTVNPVNDEQVLAVNAGTTVNEASTGNVLTSGMLLTTDVDNTSGQLVYTVTAATGNGTLRLSGTALGVSDTFTQADIDAGNVTYDHDGSETTTDSFDFSVDDGQGTASTGTFNFTVNPVNDEQVLAVNAGTTVNEASTGNVLTSGMLLTTDVDNTSGQLVYTVTAATGNGTLRLSGTALGVTDTFTQADIDAGNLTYDHDGSETTTDSFDFSVDDGQGAASTGTFNFTVNPVNDEEVLVTNAGTTVNEASTGNVLTSGMLLTTDVDNTSGQLVYTVTAATSNGTLRLSGTALGVSDTFTQADINAGNVTYDHNGTETTTDSFDFSVDDGQGTASAGTFNFTVTPVNDEEVLATNTGTTVNEGSTSNVLTSGMLQTTDVDNTSGQLIYTVTSATSNGTLRLSGTALGVTDTFTQADIDAGNVTYDHNGSETTTDSFDFSVDDGQGTASTGTFNFTVNPVNDEEVLATNTGTTVNEGSTSNVLTSGMLQTTDVDNTASQLIYTVTSATSNGTLRLSGTALGVTDTFTQADIDAGNVTYDHDGSETTTDSFDFSVDDGQGTASTGTFNFTVNPVNDEEVLVTNAGTTVNEGSTSNVLTSGMLQTTDVDNTSGQLVYTVTAATGNGTLRLSGTALGVSDTFTQADIDAGNVSYDHNGSETTTDSFDFSVDDGQGTASTGAFNFTVNPVNDEQVLAVNAGTTVNEASTGNVLTSGMLQTTDVDNTSGQLIYTVTAATSNGTLRLSGTALGVSDTFTQADIDAGNVTYDHDGSETTTDSFDFSVDDGQGAASTGTFNFTVNPVNDEEVLATNTGTTVNEGSASNVLTSGMLQTTDVDNTAAQLIYTVTSATGNGTLRLSGTALGVSDTFTQADIDAGNMTYDHDGSETTADSFDFSVDDGQGTASTGTFNLTVTPVNDSPTVATNTGMTATEASSGNVLTTAMLNEGDPDDAGAGLTYTIATATVNGTLRLSGTALGVSDTFTQADIDAGNVTYDHDGSETTTDGFDFLLSDGGEDGATPAAGTFNITITGSNDEQVLAINTGATVNEGTAGNTITTLMLQTTDVDNTPAQLVYTVTSATANGTLRLSGTALGVSDTFTQADIDAGNVTYDHDGSETITDSFDFSVDDGQGTASTGTFNFTVTPVNDEEVLATNTGTTVNEGSTSNVLTSGMLQTTDVDNTAAQLIYTVTSATSNGTLRLSGTALGVSDTFTQADIDAGNVTYDHNGSETTTDSFDFSVDDGQGTASTGTFNFTVNPVNDEEVLATNTGTTVNEASTGNVLTSGMLQTTDVDNTNAQLVYTVTGATGNGTLRLSGTALGVSDTFTQADIDAGNVTYDHNGSETTTDSFDFSVDDGQGTASTGTFNYHRQSSQRRRGAGHQHGHHGQRSFDR